MSARQVKIERWEKDTSKTFFDKFFFDGMCGRYRFSGWVRIKGFNRIGYPDLDGQIWIDDYAALARDVLKKYKDLQKYEEHIMSLIVYDIDGHDEDYGVFSVGYSEMAKDADNFIGRMYSIEDYDEVEGVSLALWISESLAEDYGEEEIKAVEDVLIDFASEFKDEYRGVMWDILKEVVRQVNSEIEYDYYDEDDNYDEEE